ncbi:MAG: hypothetical protein BAJALOKI1v1_770012 [Promethearchaeota archaeon]|nr:MAG: hypothetical protein BAJALOKI1v1_770012 [Candidatus Lokiarchaeota archaeon]
MLEFTKVSGVKTVGIILDINNPQIHLGGDETIIRSSDLMKLLDLIQKNVLNLSIRSFRLQTLEHICLCIIEDISAIFFLLEKTCNLKELRQPVNLFLNDVLISM